MTRHERDSMEQLLELAAQAHTTCEWSSNKACDAEEYGDGNASEHAILRDAAKILERINPGV